MVLFDDAMREAIKYDAPIYEAAGMEPQQEESEQLKTFLRASANRTNGELKNLTQSMGFAQKVGGRLVFKSAARYYQDALDFALVKVQSGEQDAASAIRQAVGELAGGGLRVVDYATGHKNRIDVAVRRAVLSGIRILREKLPGCVGRRWVLPFGRFLPIPAPALLTGNGKANALILLVLITPLSKS